ncbi:unnamed protein product [Rotaria sp. Silwood1]|nr:unnamed protein product [Rotaria sp. Silwood1]
MEATQSEESLYFVINQILRTANRRKLQPSNGLVFRGINGDLSNDYKVDDKLVCEELSDIAKDLHKGIKTHKTIDLKIRLQQLSNKDLKSIAETLKMNTSVRSLTIEDPPSTTSTTDNGLRISICESATKLETLCNWDCDSLTVESAATLAKLLNTTKCLESLNLSMKQCDGQWSNVIADALHKNNTLTLLYMPNTNIGDEGAMALSKMLAKE